jgi:vesicle-fusing ATPase
MPLPNLHMTTMEVTHSLPASSISHLVSILLPNIDAIVDLPYHHRARLIKPLLSYDSAALALSFVPASGEAVPEDRRPSEDEYTYHHLRRDLYNSIEDAGVNVASRYVVPSAHLTIARFNTPNVFGGGEGLLDQAPALDPKKRRRWIREIELINDWLEATYWPQQGREIVPGGEWIVGEERGIDFRKGSLWYGGGETVKLGTSFAHR